MDIYWNPFDACRAELMVDDILDYFVEPDFLPALIDNKKPLVVVGGRGTGKTTLLKYLSYYNQVKIFNEEFLKKVDYIGVYHKINTNYVSAFEGNELPEQDWVKIFAHYLNIILCKELCKIMVDIKKIYFFEFEKKICNAVTSVFYGSNVDTFEDLYKYIDDKQIEIEMYINNLGRIEKPFISMAEKGHVTFCNELVKEDGFKGKWFFFLIDEYENLSLYQQKVINTYFKHAEYPYSFKICRRKEGDKTSQTLSETEVLSDPADWTIWDITKEMENKAKFTKFIKEVCKKRLEKNEYLKAKNYLDIEYFLPSISIDEESKIIEKKRPDLPYKQRLVDIVSNYPNISEEQKEEILKTVFEMESPILKRLFLCLLERDKEPLNVVYEELLKFLSKQPSKFLEGQWIHNNKTGILFLLCNEYRVQKLYCGFETYILLSCGNIRYFLELCSVAFRFAMRDGFSLKAPTPISIQHQSKAARYVAEKRLAEIAKNPPYGEIIKEFVLSIGQIFKNFHKNPKQSEAEINQFYTDYINIKQESKEIIKKALMYSVLLESSSTKNKSNYQLKNYDLFIHPIYSPFFQITPTKGRKISISPEDIDVLITGKRSEKEKIINSISKSKEAIKSSRSYYFQHSIFDSYGGEGNDND